jgi:SAM-dependent methyltransferase
MDQSRYQNQAYLRDDQYKDSRNLDARKQLHVRFGTAPVEWNTWVFDQLALQPGERVLECGCGPGWLWRNNLARIPGGCQITLTDLSPGMVAEAEAALGDAAAADFRFRPADVQDLPFPDKAFDVVAANHMLYHVPNIEKGLSEIRRVLKGNGRLHAVTNGNDHMRQLKELRQELVAQLDLDEPGLFPSPDFQLRFRLENGAELLAPHFEEVEMRPYPDSLVVTEVEPLLAYAFSSNEARTAVSPEQMDQLRQMVAARMEANDGVIEIEKAVGMFVARKAA